MGRVSSLSELQSREGRLCVTRQRNILSPPWRSEGDTKRFPPPLSIIFKVVSFQFSSSVTVPIFYFGALLSGIPDPAAGSSATFPGG